MGVFNDCGARAALLLVACVASADAQQRTCAYTSEGGVLSIVAAGDHIAARVPAVGCNADGAAVAVSPDGSQVFVGGYQEIALVDTATNRVVRRIPLAEGEVEDISFSADGERVYVSAHYTTVPSYNWRWLIVLDVTTGERVAKIDQVSNAVASGDGQRIYAIVQTELNLQTPDTIKILDASSYEVIGEIADVPSRKLLLAGDGRSLFGLMGSDLTVVDTESNQVSGPIHVPSGMADMAISPDGTQGYVASTLSGSHQMQVIALPSATPLFSIGVGGDARRVVLSPNGSLAYVAVYEMEPFSGKTYSRTKIVDIGRRGVVGSIDAGGELAVANVGHSCAAPSCEGDCNVDGLVTVDEIVKAIQMALVGISRCACDAFAVGDSPEITVDAIIRAVDHGLSGCPEACSGSSCPDLQLETGFAVYPEARGCDMPPVGDSGVMVCIDNHGGGDAGPFQVEIAGLDRYTIDGVAANGRDCRLRPFTFGFDGYTVDIDIANQVQESNEENNGGSFAIAVLTATPPCTPSPTPTPSMP